MLETVNKIFSATEATLLDLKPEGRIQMKDLSQTVGLAVAMDPKSVVEFVNYFVHNTDIVYVTRGKNGGVIRGTKPAKVEKPAKTTTKKNKVVKAEKDTDSTETI